MGQLRQCDEATLVKRYGSIGQRLYRFSRGEDYRRVTPHWPAKSLSTETTFFDDVNDFDELARRLWPLCERLSERLKAKELSGRTITLKLKTKGFRLLTRSHTLPAPTQLAETLYRTALPPLRKAADGTAYRLIGVGASMLHAAAEADPPDLADPDAGKRKRVETAMDAVRERLGREAIVKGRGFTTRERA
jgi:DNA polymerase-4